MEFEKKKHKIKELVDAWDSGQLRRNLEYQRVEAWTLAQKQSLIDSVFRRYPIPALFLECISKPGLGEEHSVSYDVVDGRSGDIHFN